MITPQPPALSPAAQAVLDAMHRSYDHEPTRRALAAGVLRAAADLGENLYDPHEGKVSVIRTGWIFAIADELDPPPPATNQPTNETP